MQLGIDYTLPHLTLKSLVGLTAAPAVDIAATSGYKDVVFGGLATFDTAKNNSLTKWSLGVGKCFPLRNTLCICRKFSVALDQLGSP